MAEAELEVKPQNDAKEEAEVERQYSDDEVRAMERGWEPKEKWQGNPDEWIPAKIFNDRGELFGRIAKDKATINELKQSVDALVEDRKKLFDAGYKRAIEDLKRDKRVALEEGDTKAVMEIDDKIDEVREQATKAQEEFNKSVTPKPQTVNPDFEAWHANNNWYLKDNSLTAFANGLAQDMVEAARSAGTTIHWGKFYNEVTRKVRQKFPEKFESRTRESVLQDDVVGSGGDSTSDKTSSRSSTTLKESDLTDDQRRIMNNILKTTKSISKKEYLEQMSLFEKRKGTR